MAKDIIRVLEAVQDGARHSADVSELTGLTVASASAHLSELAKAGLVKWTGRVYPLPRGRSYYAYEGTDG